MGELLVVVDHNQLRTMTPETVYPIDWSPSCAVPPELHVLRGANAGNKSQDLLQQQGLKYTSTVMPGQRTTCAAVMEQFRWYMCQGEI